MVKVHLLLLAPFHFEYQQREAVYKQDDVRPTSIFRFLNRELVNNERIVILRVMVIDQVNLLRPQFPFSGKFDVDAVTELIVKVLVAGDQIGFKDAGDGGYSLLKEFCRHFGVDLFQGSLQPDFQDDLLKGVLSW